MAWYSYFLLNVPEDLSMLVLTFVLLGIPIKKNRKSIIWFSFIQGGLTFILNMYMANSFKPLLLFITFSLLVAILFKIKLINSIIITLFAFVSLLLFELTIVTFSLMIFSLNFDMLLENPSKRILISLCSVTLPMLISAFILNKLQIKVKMPLLFK